MVDGFGADIALVAKRLGRWGSGMRLRGHLEGDAWKGESGSQFGGPGREEILFFTSICFGSASDESLDPFAKKRRKTFCRSSTGLHPESQSQVEITL